MLTIMTTKKLITKQNLLLAFALTACFILSFYYEGFSIILAAITILFYLPLGAIYLIRIKQETTRQSLSKIFRIANWIAIILLLLYFFRGIYEVLYLFSSSELEATVWQTLWFHIRYYFSWGYFIDGDYGLLADLKDLIAYLPYLVVPFVFYWLNRTNKALMSLQNKE